MHVENVLKCVYTVKKTHFFNTILNTFEHFLETTLAHFRTLL